MIARNDELCYYILQSKSRWDVNAATNEFFNNGWKYPEKAGNRPKADPN